ncbi:MAG: YqcC family protein [Shewanella sp.]|uniref:YqcC family protein n=2 Tax=Shewanella sp. TaxID=50422 RepID=UPI003C75E702
MFMLYLTCKKHLIILEQILKQCSLWADSTPSVQAMASSAPFACDTMAFEQWLQFIFIPKMSELIEFQHPLPANMAIAPMAEHVWQGMTDYAELIRHLRDFDTLLSQQ